MTKTTTFKTKKNNGTIFSLNNKFSYEPNYSKIIDDIILSDIIDKNSYLFNTPTYTTKSTSSYLKDDITFIKAANFLANYKKPKTIKLPYIIGKMYTLSDGTPIVFYDDEIQIGFDTYKYTDFSSLSFLNNISEPTKKIIINIYATAGTNININLL